MSPGSSDFWADIVPRVEAERCQRCADCPPVVACLSGGIVRDGPESVPVVDARTCFGCYSCASPCPHEAIILPRAR